MRAKDYIKHLLAIENYSFSLEEIIEQTHSDRVALKFELARLVEKMEIVNLRKGFYLIIPPRYSKSGLLPIQLYIEKLFKSLDRRYYLCHYSAAKFHGASHQQSQREYVMTESPKLGDIKKKGMDIRFFTLSQWPSANISERRSDAGIFRISSPALTAIDLIHYQSKLGGINRMLAVIEELAEEISQQDLSELLSWYPHKSSLQRLGFILELVRPELASEAILDLLKSEGYFPVLLSPTAFQKPGAVDNRWKVDVNVKLENDL
ncbi:type IV toxin-antitoxin system AbiEi family antitoxin [Algoriphagus jejuensis]|uniref:Type IV toxin-antitoxin system AbiEi family antitoxin n=1 Tax=Algoriphagus jejuensis TaxID=419934 RepID=A0ABN1MYK1_9BACT